jgi:hypothetical protein
MPMRERMVATRTRQRMPDTTYPHKRSGRLARCGNFKCQKLNINISKQYWTRIWRPS